MGAVFDETRLARREGVIGISEASTVAHRPTSAGEVREVVLRLRQPQFAKLVEQSRARGKTPAAWALDLFQAAYSARTAPTGDADLDAAVAAIGSSDAGAISAPQASNVRQWMAAAADADSRATLATAALEAERAAHAEFRRQTEAETAELGGLLKRFRAQQDELLAELERLKAETVTITGPVMERVDAPAVRASPPPARMMP